MDLTLLAKKYRSDKLENGYLEFYSKIFEPYRTEVKNILEIGIFSGASLKMWSDYFPHAQIVGIDIVPTQINHERVATEQGNQVDIEFLNRVVEKYGKFDIIIDDGSHMVSHQVKSFQHLMLNGVKSRGIYVIEDIGTNYLHPYVDSDYTVPFMVKDIWDNVNHHYIAKHEVLGQFTKPMALGPHAAVIDYIVIKQWLCFFFRK